MLDCGLIEEAGDYSSEASNARRLFQSELLPSTLLNAYRTPFYQNKWGEISTETINLDNLSSLPLVTKAEIKAAGKSAQNRHGLVCNEIFTGGTTGSPLVTVKGNREQKYIYEFYHEVFGSLTAKKYRALQINNPYHGHLVNVPVPMYSHKIGIYDNGSFEHGRWVLQSQHQDEGVEDQCTVLIGLERCLRAFAMDTLKGHPDGIETDLRYVISYSQILTRKWKKIFEQTWNCSIIDRFGLSEVFGGATLEPQSGWWKFDPVLIPEVIGINSQQKVDEGLGILVLTGLFPFQEAQPMVRYYTGDLVATKRNSFDGSVLIKPLGRANFGVPCRDSDQWLLTPLAVLEAVEDIDNIQKIPRFLDASQVADPYSIGHPMYQLSYRHNEAGTHITLEILLDKVGKKHAELRTKSVTDNLMENANLKAAVDEGVVTLAVSAVNDLRTDLISHSN